MEVCGVGDGMRRVVLGMERLIQWILLFLNVFLCWKEKISSIFGLWLIQQLYYVMVLTFSTLFFFDLILLFLFVDRELDGSLWGWGVNEHGELGLGHKNPVSSPTKMSLTSVRHLQVGAYHVIAVCSNIFDDCKTHNNNRWCKCLDMGMEWRWPIRNWELFIKRLLFSCWSIFCSMLCGLCCCFWIQFIFDIK